MLRFKILIVVVLLVFGGWTAGWFYGASRLGDGIDAWLQASQAGPEPVTCEQLDVAGFPFRFDVSCTGLALTSGDFSFRLENLKATILVYRPTHALIFASGPATFLDTFSGSSRELRWDNLRASARTNGWALARISLEADNVELIDTLVGEKLVARIGRAEAHLLDIPENYNAEAGLAEWSALARISDAGIPEFNVSGANIEMEAIVQSMPDDLRLINASSIARNWFEAGNGIELTKLAGSDEQSELELSGRVSATEEARLSGDFGLHTKNIANRLSGFLEPQVLQILFGFRGEEGDYDQSFSFRYGVLLAGNLPVLTLPPLS